MKTLCASLKRTLAGAAVIVAFAIAGPSVASAEETTTTEGTTTTASVEADTPGASSELKICEAVQRTDARYKKWVEQGIPEEFGSEEPFTFDPSLC